MLFDEQELQKELSISLSECQDSVIILSAFIKQAAFKWFIDQFSQKDIQVIVVARWTLADLLCGVSDLEVYELCKSQDWIFKIDQRLHSKLYLIDSKFAFVGSSNLTGAGLGLHRKSNFELSTKTDMSEIDLSKVNKYLDSCITMTDELFQEIISVYEKSEKVKVTRKEKWPEAITLLLEQEIDHLWVDELFFTDPMDSSSNTEYLQHDLELLGITKLSDKENINSNQIRSIKWLKCQLNKEESKSLKFGALSKLLHNALLNDPKPYRKDVIELQKNLRKWIKYLELDEFKFETYNVSETIYLTDEITNQKL